MRTVIFGGANTLDNFIAGPDGGIDWIRHDRDAMAVLGKMWKTMDTIVMGRKTYEASLKMAGEGEAPPDHAFQGITTYVLSRTMTGEPKNGTLVREDGAEFVRRLKQQPGKDICVGSLSIASQLSERGLIDEYRFVVHPVVAGKGPRLFETVTPQGRLQLDFIGSEAFQSGVIALHYRKHS